MMKYSQMARHQYHRAVKFCAPLYENCAVRYKAWQRQLQHHRTTSPKWQNNNIHLRAISHCCKYSLRVLAEKVISLVLPLSIHTDTNARIARASTRGENDLLAGSR